MRKFLTDLGYIEVRDFINICNSFGSRLSENQKQKAILDCIKNEPLTKKSIYRYLRNEYEKVLRQD